MNPYEDLTSSRIRSQLNTSGAAKHFNEDDVVNFDEDALHSDLAAVQPSYIPHGATVDNSGFADISEVTITLLNDLTNDKQTVVELKGSGSMKRTGVCSLLCPKGTRPAHPFGATPSTHSVLRHLLVNNRLRGVFVACVHTLD